MLDVETAIVLGRLALVAVVVVGPTLLFLGLIRGLAWARNDALIAEWTARDDSEFDPAQLDDVLGVLASGLGIDGSEQSLACCPSCGATNPDHARFCGECLAKHP